MKKYGLIGYPITHSFSPGYFAEKYKREQIFNARYDLYPIEHIAMFDDITEVSGINVTIPYKEAVIPYLDELSEDAQTIGAVNTIKYQDGKRIGYNTDVYGFEQSLLPLIKERRPERALVLGTGGAAKAVWFVLDRLKIPYLRISRSQGDLRYSDLDLKVIEEHHLIINTTPLGMAPNIDQCPEIPYEDISTQHILYDLIYNPQKTLFLNKGSERGAVVKNGLNMLELQAEKAWEIWNTP